MVEEDQHGGDNGEEDKARLEALLEAGYDIAGSTAGALIGVGVGGPMGVAVGAASGPVISHTAFHLASEIKQRFLGPREERRIGATLVFAGEKIRENRKEGYRLRQDGFFRERTDDRAAAEEIFEGVLVAARREPQEKKLRFYGNLLANIAFAPQISRERANLLIKVARILTYRQLCLLVIFAEEDPSVWGLRQGDYRDGALIGANADTIAAI